MTVRLIDLPVGTVRGEEDGGVVRSRGIRYALAEPQGEPRPWSGPEGDDVGLQAEHPPASPQTSSAMLKTLLGGFPDHMGQDPQCQYLSVTAPASAREGAGLPVMVWIHGGGNANSNPEFSVYDPRWLVEEQQVVVVKPTYRLGYLGFGGHRADHPPNLGAMDLLEALRWIRAHVGAFGGDAGNVTLFGQSSGGDMALSLMGTPQAEGLFHRVIAQSPPLGIRGMSARLRAKITAKVDEEAASQASPTLVQYQQAIEKAAWLYGSGFMPFGIQWDAPPFAGPGTKRSKILAGSRGRDVLIGTNDAESGMYLPVVPGVRRVYDDPRWQRWVRLLLVRPTTYGIFSGASRRMSKALRRTARSSAYYRFSWTPTPGTAAIHLAELPLLFGGPRNPTWKGSPLLPVRGEGEISRADDAGREMRSVWGDFARSGRIGGIAALDGHLRFEG